QHDRALTSHFTKRLLQEIAYLTTTLADHRDHDNIGLDMPGHHPEQRTFTDTATRENTDTLSLGQRHYRIDCRDPGFKHMLQRRALHRVDRQRLHVPIVFGGNSRTTIETFAES